MKEKMGLGLAVFNCHDSDLRKARQVFYSRFNKATYMDRVHPFMRKGIMRIFDEKPNRHTLFFTRALAKFVNRRLKLG